MSDMPPVPKDGHQTQNTQQNQFLKEIYNKEARSHIKQLKLMPRNPILAELTPREQPKSSTASSDSNSNNKPHSSKFSFTKTNPRENTFKNSFNRTETKGNHNFDKQAHSLRKDDKTWVHDPVLKAILKPFQNDAKIISKRSQDHPKTA